MICSTLSGQMAIKHPTLGVLVREDGMILNRASSGRCEYNWTAGCVDRKSGYLVIKIHKKKYSSHRVVAEAFIPNPENKPTVDHINRVRDDNRVCNLRWASHHEQCENRITTINRKDYGVRWCDDPDQYRKNWRKANPERYKESYTKYNKMHGKGKRKRS